MIADNSLSLTRSSISFSSNFMPFSSMQAFITRRRSDCWIRPSSETSVGIYYSASHPSSLRTRLKQVSPNPRDPKRCEFPEDKSIKMPLAAPAAKNSNYKMHFYSLTRIWSINENVARRTDLSVCLSVSAVLIPFPNLS